MVTSSVQALRDPVGRAEALLKRIRCEFPTLSGQLQAIAQHVERHHERLVLHGIREVAEQCAVHPSAVVRFAQRFGFSGYNELRQQFRDSLVLPRPATGTIPPAGRAATATDIAEAVIEASIAALRDLRRDLRGPELCAAVECIAGAQALWLLGSAGAFPVAVSLAQALQQHARVPVQLVHQLGGMHLGQLRGVREGDVMIVVSLRPDARETLESARLARDQGARLIVLTDDPFCPVARQGEIVLVHGDAGTPDSIGQACAMALGHALVRALRPSTGAADAGPAGVAAPARPRAVG